MFKILVTDNMQLGEYDFPDVILDDRAGIERAELLKIVADYDALITRSRTQVDAELIAAATNLKVLGRGGVGIDNIDVDSASQRGILVLNAPEANNVSAAELAITLMLSAARGVAKSDRLIRKGTWDRKYLGRELKGATLGVVGLGRIGSLVTRRAQGLGMTVIGYDPYLSRRRAEDLNVELFDDLKTMLAKANFLTVHTPLTDETFGMIGADELAAMPDQAIVVNAARGGIIQEQALYDALKSGKLFAAGLDVFVNEPPKVDHPLLELDNVVFTAHLGANTVEAQARVGTEILERVVLGLRGDYSRGAVNAPALAPDVMAALGPYLKLGEILGKMASQLAKGRTKDLAIEFSGTFPRDPDPVAIAVTKGFLEPILDETPNYINAPSIAKSRDIRVSKVSDARPRAYTSHVLVSAISDEGRVAIGGTVFGDSPRIVLINDFRIEVLPQGTLLICTNYDRPGAIGKVGTALGNAGINISSMQLSRIGADDLAMFVLTLDQVPADDDLESLRKMSDVINSLEMVKL
ncbi:MAG: phosphoglycerate dehydrogenase [Trueperaceae bacterium]|nr:phosphoglycerate dehydrogenase [Trueperaceae bacterium]